MNQNNKVTFWARPKKSNRKRRGMNQPEPFTLCGTEFLRRWSLHILPKGFTRSRSYGGFHNRNRENYLKQCHQLLNAETSFESTVGPSAAESLELIGTDSHELADSIETKPQSHPKCPQCKIELEPIRWSARPSWQDLLPKLSCSSPKKHSGSHSIANKANTTNKADEVTTASIASAASSISRAPP